MNETMNSILTRRSIRNYLNKPIPEDILNQILLAGTYAPSAKNKQSAIIIAVTNPEIIKRLSQLNASIMGNKSIDPFYNAPAVLIVLADKNNKNHLYDGTLVMANLMLAAQAFNLGTCWIHRAKEMFEAKEGKEILKSLNIPFDEYEGIGNCIIGYPANTNIQPSARKNNFIYYIR